MIPTIHLNGTSGQVLLEQTEAALRAVLAAIIAVCDAAPNGRDFYIQGPDALTRAREEHLRHLSALTTVRDDLLSKLEGIRDQIDAIEARKAERKS